MSADPPGIHQWADQDQDQDQQYNYALSGKIMLSSIIILFVVVIFLILLHLYARWYLRRLHRHNDTRRRNRRDHIVFHVDNNTTVISSPPTGGLDATVLKSLPVFVYSSQNSYQNLGECAVCLSEFQDGETGRVLPKCKHGFHTECIDMWFHSHSTCPLCRAPVEPAEMKINLTNEPGSSGWFNETTSFEDRRKGIDVRIDIPSRNELLTDSSFRMMSPTLGFRSPGSRLQSLKRILTMSRRSPAVSPSAGVGPSSSSSSVMPPVETGQSSDIESVGQQQTANETTR